MSHTCVTCGEPISAGDYRLVGITPGTWASRYAHRGTCAEAALPRPRARPPAAPVVEELKLDARPEPLPEEGLPWVAVGRRR